MGTRVPVGEREAGADGGEVTASGSPTSSRYRADVQGLRAVAVLAVVAFHAGMGFSGGFVGVDVFFVVSGFVITGMLRAESTRSGRISLGRFYLRRIRRLLPALAVLLLAVLVAAPLLGPRNTGPDTVDLARAGALFGANVQLFLSSQGYFDPRVEANPLLHLWTLSLEEQVYLVFPLLLIGAHRLGRRWCSWTRSAVIASAVGAVASFALAAVLAAQPGESAARLAFYSSPTRAWEFLAGALVALAPWSFGPRWRAAFGVLGGVALAVAFLAFDARTSFPWIVATVPVVATALLLVAGSGAGSAPSRALSAGPLTWIGDRSYSWYLWHWPAIVFARALFPGAGWAAPAAAVLSLVPACLSYVLVEQPFRHRTGSRPRATLALGAACVIAPLVFAPVSTAMGTRLSEAPSVRAFDRALEPHESRGERCSTGPFDLDVQADCRWPAATSTGTVALVGDSNGGHLSEGFLDAAASLDLDATMKVRSGCPFIDLRFRRSGSPDTTCREHYEGQLAALLAERPAAVVIGNAGDLLLPKPEVAMAAAEGGSYVTDDAAQVRRWAEGLDRTLSTLEQAGIGVVLVRPVPRFTGWAAPGECARLRVVVDVDGCGSDRVVPDAAGLVAAESRVAAAHPGTVVVDLEPTLCAGGPCTTQRDGTWIWKDESHISVAASRSVAPDLAAAIQEAVTRAR